MVYDWLWAEPLGSALARAVVRSAGPPSRVVDVGAGTGFIGAALARAGHRVVCLDASTAMARRAAVRHPGLAAAIGAVERLPIRPGHADVVVATNLMHLHPEPDVVLESLLSLVAGGGRLICSWPAGDAGLLTVARAERREGLPKAAAAARLGVRCLVGVAGAMAGMRRTPERTVREAVLRTTGRWNLPTEWMDLPDCVQTLVTIRR